MVALKPISPSQSCILLKRTFTLISRHGIASDSTRKPREYWLLDRNCKAFLASMPPLDATLTTSPDRLVAFNNTNLALIHLHEHFAFPLNLTNVTEHLPTQRLTLAAGDIIRTAHQLVSTSYDFALCHPHNFICWAVASRVVAKERDRRRASDIDADVQDLELEFNAIVAALNRGAAKSYKAERLVELVLRMKSGAYSESVLRSVGRVCARRAGRSCRPLFSSPSYLLYVDSVLPRER